MRLALHLRDVFLTNEDFVREQSTTFELVDIEDINPSQHPLTSLYIRQWYPTRNRNWEDIEKCVVKLAGVDAQEAASRIANFDSNCDLSDGLMIMNMASIPDGLLSRLVVMCKDGNLFQILLSKHGRSLLANISACTTGLHNIQDLNVLKKEQNEQDRIVKVLGNGQHIHIAIKKRVLLLHGERCLTGVVEISYSSSLKGVWLEHIAIVENGAKEKTFLSYAAKRGLKTVVEHLSDREGIESNSKEDLRTPLSWAAEGGQEEVVKHLLERGAALESKDKDGRTPLSWAAGSGHEAIVRLLLSKAAVFKVIERNIGDRKLQSRAGWQWIVPPKAVSKRNNSRIGRVWPMPEDMNGRTPLFYAAQSGHLGVIQLLLEKDADITVASKGGWTPLHSAAGNGHLDIVQLLLEKGADITVASKGGWTPLHSATDNGHLDIVQLLLEKGAELETKDSNGATPLSLAARNGHEAVVKQLLDKGAELEAKDSKGRTPLQLATLNVHEAVVKLLLEKGAEMTFTNFLKRFEEFEHET